jgi:hypothetical protein
MWSLKSLSSAFDNEADVLVTICTVIREAPDSNFCVVIIIIIIIMVLQPSVAPWPLFQLLDPVHSR